MVALAIHPTAMLATAILLVAMPATALLLTAMTATTARAIASPVGGNPSRSLALRPQQGAAPKGALAGCSLHR